GGSAGSVRRGGPGGCPSQCSLPALLVYGVVDQRDLQPLVDAALAAGADDLQAADFAGVAHVGATVGLQIEPLDLDHPHLLDVGGQEVDLGADQVGDLECLLARQGAPGDRQSRGDPLVGGPLDVGHALRIEVFQFKVHACFVGAHIAAGDQRAVLAEDDAAEDVERGVHAHEPVPSIPVDLTPERGAGRGRSTTFQHVHDLTVLAGDAHDLPGVCAVG